MMTELVSILFACTAAIHLGLLSAIEEVAEVKLKLFECVKCLTFWVTLLYMIVSVKSGLFVSMAVAFMNAWLSMWLEMGMGYVDTLYYKVYEKIYPTTDDDDKAPSNDGEASAGNELPDMREEDVVSKN